VRLDKDTSLGPMRTPASTEDLRREFMVESPLQSELNLSPSLECRSSGFGEMDRGTHQPYFMTSDQSPKEGLRAYQTVDDDGVLVVSGLHHPTSANFRHGDSGGAFYCRSGPGQPWALIGIISLNFKYQSGQSAGYGMVTGTTSAP